MTLSRGSRTENDHVDESIQLQLGMSLSALFDHYGDGAAMRTGPGKGALGVRLALSALRHFRAWLFLCQRRQLLAMPGCRMQTSLRSHLPTHPRSLLVPWWPLTDAGEHKPGYTADLRPILDKYCAECHMLDMEGVKKSGFQSDSYTSIMKGTKLRPVIVPRSAESSTLYILVAGKEPLSAKEIETIRLWIDHDVVKHFVTTS